MPPNGKKKQRVILWNSQKSLPGSSHDFWVKKYSYPKLFLGEDLDYGYRQGTVKAMGQKLYTLPAGDKLLEIGLEQHIIAAVVNNNMIEQIGAADALAETGKGTTNYIIALGIVETVALFVMVFLMGQIGVFTG